MPFVYQLGIGEAEEWKEGREIKRFDWKQSAEFKGGDVLEKQEEKYYHILYKIAAAVNSAGAPDDVLRSIVGSVATAMDAKGCSLMLVTPDKKLLLYQRTEVKEW